MKPKLHPQQDRFIIDAYNEAPPFSNFFPALAGVAGKPMWVFYTNRGQAVASFGVNNKDGAMLEFLPANKAYQATSIVGFRTFIKTIGKNGAFFEPFAIGTDSHQSLVIRPFEIELIDRNTREGVEVRVSFFGVPNESCPVLARSVTVKNISSRATSFYLVDGMPRVVPWGMNDFLVKNMSRTIEAFAEVANLKAMIPFFKLKVEPADRPDVKPLDAGFFSFALSESDFLPCAVDPSVVFGHDTAFLKPLALIENGSIAGAKQLASNIMPSSFFHGSVALKPGQSRTWHSYYGYAETLSEANAFAEHVRGEDRYFDARREEMARIYADLVGHFGFETGDDNLNLYGQVTFMDNVLRGGFPMSFGPNGPVTHVFSRKHGDMERDYNAFQVSATYYSQGNGNFRDVNQNRRNDLFFNPSVGTSNIDVFFNLLQLDGYNPLVINPVRFLVPRDALSRLVVKPSDRSQKDQQALLKEPVLAGQIYEFVKRHSADPLNVNNQFRDLITASIPQQGIQHGEGFWIDHWTYNLDHLDQYLSVYPDKKSWLLFEKRDFSFFDGDHFVRPRRDKYVVTSDGKLRQYDAVQADPQKRALIASRNIDAQKVRTANGTGDILYVTLFTKLLALAAIKFATLDPAGVGIEMEADKPGWCDALNGLPGVFGSSSHEMFEVLRLVRFLVNEAMPAAPNKTMELPVEIAQLVKDVESALDQEGASDFRPVWDRLAAARESFREKTFFGVSGKMRDVRLVDVKEALTRAMSTLQRAAQRATDPKTGIPTSYFTYEVNVSDLADGWRQYLAKLPWKQRRVAPFLEGAVHALKLAEPGRARQIYQAVKRSELFDRKLDMYKLNVSLAAEPRELGRIKVFSPGWLENESIFLHMHYKYLLEILRSGMTETYWSEAATGLIPARDPDQYGRPTFENCSFLASSSFPDASYHGRGFVARLSGATSEFLSMVYFAAFGPRIFRAAGDGVVFAPEPRLPRTWFAKGGADGAGPKNRFSIKLFGTPITYINNARKDTYGTGAAKPVEYEWILDGRFYRHKGKQLTPEASAALREGRLEQLTVTLA